jgi:hypothetical protein
LSFQNPELLQVDMILFLELDVMSRVLALTGVKETIANGFMMFE